MVLFHLTMLESSDGPNQICHVAVSLECHHSNLFQNCRRGLEKKKIAYLLINFKNIYYTVSNKMFWTILQATGQSIKEALYITGKRCKNDHSLSFNDRCSNWIDL